MTSYFPGNCCATTAGPITAPIIPGSPRPKFSGPRIVRFDFADTSDRELPLILGLMPVLPKHAIDVATFEKSTLAKPIGSGPYVVAAVDPGKSVTFKRDPNYWGRNLPINRGLWNFDELRFDFYRDDNAYFEAFKAGLYDVRSETDPTRWQTGYNFPAVRDGRVVKDTFRSGLPKFASDFVFNTRRPIFADVRVRQAIALLFDFQWVNRNFFYNLYQRSASFFDDSELSAYHRPADQQERALLAPYREAVRADVLDGTWSPPVSDGSGRDRATLRQALGLLDAAGYQLKGTMLRERVSGRQFAFRDHGHQSRRRAPGARLFRHAGARRHRRAGPSGGRRAVRRAPGVVRFRYDRISLGRVAVAGQ